LHSTSWSAQPLEFVQFESAVVSDGQAFGQAVPAEMMQ